MACALFSSGIVQALEPADVNFGIFTLTPQLELSTLSDSNIYKTNTDEQSSQITKFNPSARISTKDKNREYYSDVYFLSGMYSDSGEGTDDYTDYGIAIGADLGVGTRYKTSLSASRNNHHDDRGSAFTAGQAGSISEPDQYDTSTAGASLNLGKNNAKFRFTLGVNQLSKEYSNNAATTQSRDYDSLALDGAFYFQTLSRTSLFVSAASKEVEYALDNPSSSLAQTFDSSETAAYLGIEWKATAKTSGNAKIGTVTKDFDDELLADLDSTSSWGLNIDYQGSKDASLTLSSSSSVSENEGSGSAKKSNLHTIAWAQNWPRSIATQYQYALSKDDHEGSVRIDDTKTLSLSLIYNFRRWIDFNVSHNIVNRSSSVQDFEFKTNITQIGLTAAL